MAKIRLVPRASATNYLPFLEKGSLLGKEQVRRKGKENTHQNKGRIA